MPLSRSKISAYERITCGHCQSQRIGYVGKSSDVTVVSTCTYHALTASRASKAGSVSI